jgi:hypothetical protein
LLNICNVLPEPDLFHAIFGRPVSQFGDIGGDWKSWGIRSKAGVHMGVQNDFCGIEDQYPCGFREIFRAVSHQDERQRPLSSDTQRPFSFLNPGIIAQQSIGAVVDL